MTVTPDHLESIGPHQRERQRPDVCRYTLWVQQGPAAHLLDAGGAGAGQAKGPGRIKPPVPLLVPFDQDSVVSAVNGVGNGEGHEGLLAIGYWLLAIGYWLLAIGYWLLAIGYWLLAIGYWLLAIRK
jgi:hypothetical protein